MKKKLPIWFSFKIKNKPLKKMMLLTMLALLFPLLTISQTVYTFTNAGATGRYGPSQAQVNAAYTSTTLDGQVTATSGIQYWTVPAGIYNIRIEAFGAKGGSSSPYSGGNGAKMQGDFSVTPGQVLKILVGQMGTDVASWASGGGGGTFVATNTNVPLIIAGGGSGSTNVLNGRAGQTTQAGYSGDNCSNTGTTGYGGGDASACGSGAGGAGGFYGDGASASGWGSQRGFGFVNDGAGGTSATNDAHGGFGGGAGTHSNNTGGGAGGGYTGGGAAYHGSNYVGGPGSSYNSGTNQVATIGANATHGKVVITSLFSASITQTAPVLCNGGSTGALTVTTNPPSVAGSQTFSYTGSIETWTVPAGVTSIDIDARGAQGGNEPTTYTGGLGARMTGKFAVTPGQVLSILVGQQPVATHEPGGGGGTFVALGNSYLTATPMIVAGGGGGPAGHSANGGPGLTTNNGGGTYGGVGGNGATAAPCAGGGGGFYTNGATGTTYGAGGGFAFRNGGAGGTAPSGGGAGGFGGGGAGDTPGSCDNGGGGGGYSGGSGEAGYNIGNGGGSFNSGTNQSNTAGFQTGNGQVTITYSSSTYAWSPNVSSTSTATGLAAGTYTVTVTDGFGSTATASYTITEPSAITATTSQIDVTCAGGTDGSATVVPTGGTGSYSYAWSPSGGTAATATGLSVGSYSCLITDANSCTLTKNFNITQSDLVNPTAIAQNITIYLDGSGNASIVAADINNGSTDNCSIASMTASKTNFTCADLGANNVTLTVTDPSGNFATAISVVTVVDNTSPVANVVSLADVTSECSVTSLTAPTATDNCAGTVTATHSTTLPITTQGTTIVTWTYNDGNGNTSTQTQNVVIDDVTAPVPVLVTLSDITGECSVASLTAPTATDNCASTVTVTNNATLPITTQGTTVVTWTYDDGNGNTSTQTQNVIIDDVIAPVPVLVTLSDITGECSVTSLTAPTATDNCASTVTVTNNATLPITTQGTTVVTWTYDDGNGNTVTQNQNVILDDVTLPIPDVTSLSDITSECAVTSLIAPTATDNCAGTITGIHNASLPISALGTTVVTWTYDDGNGNTVTQTQNVIINAIDTVVNESTNLLTANEASATTYQWVDCNNSYQPIVGATSQSFSPAANGSYAVIVTMGSCSDTSFCHDVILIGVTENNSNTSISVYPNPANDYVTIETSFNTQSNFILYDVNGKTVYTSEMIPSGRSLTSIDISGIAQGVYYVKVYSAKNVIVKKFVKQK